MCRLRWGHIWLVRYDARYYSTIKRHQHALVVNKKSMRNHTLAVVFSCVLKKVEAVKEEGIRAWGKQFYVLAQCHVDFMSHFYWLVSKRGSYQRTHCAMITLYRRLFLVARPWKRPSLNLSHCTTQDHRLGVTITEIATIVSQCQSFVWHRQKSYKIKIIRLRYKIKIIRAVCLGLSLKYLVFRRLTNV